MASTFLGMWLNKCHSSFSIAFDHILLLRHQQGRLKIVIMFPRVLILF